MKLLRRFVEFMKRETRSWMIPLVWFLFPNHFWAGKAKAQSRFSPFVYKQLLIAGWYPGRKIPLVPYVFPTDLHPCAIAVLEEFGGFTIGQEDSSRYSCGVDHQLSLVTVATDDDVDLGYPEEIEAFRKLELCDIGLIDHVVDLLIEPSGYIYVLTGKNIQPIAPTFERALELLLSGTKSTPDDLKQARRFEHVEGTRFVFREA
jgi:hypothetical protein